MGKNMQILWPKYYAVEVLIRIKNKYLKYNKRKQNNLMSLNRHKLQRKIASTLP